MQSFEPPKGWANLQIWGKRKKRLPVANAIPPAPSLTINRLAGPAETMVCLFSAEGACIGGLADLSKRSD